MDIMPNHAFFSGMLGYEATRQSSPAVGGGKFRQVEPKGSGLRQLPVS